MKYYLLSALSLTCLRHASAQTITIEMIDTATHTSNPSATQASQGTPDVLFTILAVSAIGVGQDGATTYVETEELSAMSTASTNQFTFEEDASGVKYTETVTAAHETEVLGLSCTFGSAGSGGCVENGQVINSAGTSTAVVTRTGSIIPIFTITASANATASASATATGNSKPNATNMGGSTSGALMIRTEWALPLSSSLLFVLWGSL